MHRITYWAIHTALTMLIVFSRFDSAVISLAIIVVIFSNLGSNDSKSSWSAYSIFNKGCQYLLGEARADQLDKQIRGGGAGGEASGLEETPHSSFLNIPSKYINRPCPCGSGLKAKKCHAKKRVDATDRGSRSTKQDPDFDFTEFEVLQ